MIINDLKEQINSSMIDDADKSSSESEFLPPKAKSKQLAIGGATFCLVLTVVIIMAANGGSPTINWEDLS